MERGWSHVPLHSHLPPMAQVKPCFIRGVVALHTADLLPFSIACACAWLEWWIPLHVASLAIGVIAAVKLGKHAMLSIHSALWQHAIDFRAANDEGEKRAVALSAHDKVRIRDNIMCAQ